MCIYLFLGEINIKRFIDTIITKPDGSAAEGATVRVFLTENNTAAGQPATTDADAIRIVYDGEGASAENLPPDGSVSVTRNGADLVVMSRSNGAVEFDISGTTADGGKGISADGDGRIYTTSAGATDSYTAACIKSNQNILLLGGNISCHSSGAGGKGINADLILNAGTSGERFQVSGTRLLQHTSSKIVLYEKIELITPNNSNALMEDLRRRTGPGITKIEIGHIDFLRDAAVVAGRGISRNLALRLEATYAIWGKPLKPFLSCEISTHLNDPETRYDPARLRLQGGVAWRINRTTSADFFLRWDEYLKNLDPRVVSLGITWKI